MAANTQSEKQLRWRYYIDKKFQNQFMLRFSLVILLVFLATIGILALLNANAYSLLPDNSGILYSVTLPSPGATLPGGMQFMPNKPYNAWQLYWPPIVMVGTINLILIVVFSLFYSHSMAGPMHNIKRSLEELASGGEAKPIRVRKGDQFQDLADLLNQVIEKRVK